MHRTDLATNAQAVGEALNKLRLNLLDANYSYTAGLLRAAEEALVIAEQGLSDTGVDDTEL